MGLQTGSASDPLHVLFIRLIGDSGCCSYLLRSDDHEHRHHGHYGAHHDGHGEYNAHHGQRGGVLLLAGLLHQLLQRHVLVEAVVRGVQTHAVQDDHEDGSNQGQGTQNDPSRGQGDATAALVEDGHRGEPVAGDAQFRTARL